MTATFSVVSRRERVATATFVLAPFVGLVIAIWSLWGRGVSGLELALFLGFSALTSLGVTIGFHRLLTHRAFEADPWLKNLFAILGSLAIQGRVLDWVGWHGAHHTHSDSVGDPHSPHRYGAGLRNFCKGYLFAHCGWFFLIGEPIGDKYIKHLLASRAMRIINALFPLWIVVSLTLPALIAWLVTGTLAGAWWGFLWGSAVRLFFTSHVTWSINSWCHVFGRQPFQTGDQSRNSWLFGLLGWGEGWHNNHHADLRSARHGFRWWQVDLSWYLIWLMERVGLVWDVQLPKTKTPA